ncbi:membrane protein [Ectopseudomonas mendocina]|nr:membrane protein [Pseudomonas mendocina]
MARAKKPLPSLDWLEPRLKLSRALSLLSFVALTALLLVWNLAFADLHGARIGVVLAIQLLPLALLAPGMLMGNARAHAWCCFVVNIYFIQGVLAAIDPARALFGVLAALISFNLFCTALLYTRWRFQYDRKMAGE